MPHPLVTQLRFTRTEWVRGLKAVTAEEAARRFGPINPIAWMIGHLAWQEQLYWLEETPGTKLHRTTYHYWFHLGESQAIRQLLGPAKKLPDFVGGFGSSQYRPEAPPRPRSR